MSKAAEILRKQGVKKMSYAERQSVSEELKEIKEQLRESEPGAATAAVPARLQDKPALISRQKKLEGLLEQDQDLVAKGRDRDFLAKERDELVRDIKNGLPTENESKMQPKNQMDFERAVQKTMAHEAKMGAKKRRLQEILRQLEPENPDAGSLSFLYR